LKLELSEIDMQRNSCAWTVTRSAKFFTKLKTGSRRLKTVLTAENVDLVANDKQHVKL